MGFFVVMSIVAIDMELVFVIIRHWGCHIIVIGKWQFHLVNNYCTFY